jgi:S1-C subfamily serine protease
MSNIYKIAEKNVVRIECENIIQNIMIPYEKKSMGNSFGSGFFIDKKYILTNHHVIEYSNKIFINIPFLGKHNYIAKLTCYSIDNDYAILEILDYNNKSDLFKIGDSNKLGQGEKLKVAGFPLGNINPNLKIVDGVLTGWERNKLQHDTNTNPGMSGGVILNSKNEAVGIHIGVISGKGWTNTAYAIPINIMNLKKRIELSKKSKKLPIEIKTPLFGFNTQISHSDLMKAAVKDAKYYKDNMGVIVTKVFKDFKTELQPGDIIYKIQGHIIDYFKDINFKCNTSNQITYEYLSDYYDVGDKYDLIYYSRSKNKLLKEEHLFQDKDLHIDKTLKEINYLEDKINYVNFGGFIVLELTLTHLQNFLENKDTELVYKFMKFKNKNSKKTILFVSYIYPTTSIYRNKIIVTGSIIQKVNNIDVYTLDDYKNQIKKSKKYITYVLDNNKIEVLNIEKTLKNEKILSSQFNFPIISYL